MPNHILQQDSDLHTTRVRVRVRVRVKVRVRVRVRVRVKTHKIRSCKTRPDVRDEARQRQDKITDKDKIRQRLD